MQDVMLDLETMGSGPNAAIVAIGAVEFDTGTRKLGRNFYQSIKLASSAETGGHIDADTVCWWLKQGDDARREITNATATMRTGLRLFTEWMLPLDPSNVRVWGNGAGFDNVILAQAFKRSHLQPPWLHWNDRCYRTIKAMCPDIKLQRIGTHHNALADAVSQAQHLIEIINA